MSQTNKNQATLSSKYEKELKLVMALQGEELGSELMGLLSMFGSSFPGLVVETYALSKAYAALLVIAEDTGFDVNDLFAKLYPTFIGDMKKALAEAEAEENV